MGESNTSTPSPSSSSAAGRGLGGSGTGSGSGLPLYNNKPSPGINTESSNEHPSHLSFGGIIEEGESVGETDEKSVEVEEGKSKMIDRSKLKNLKKTRSRGSMMSPSPSLSRHHSGFSAGTAKKQTNKETNKPTNNQPTNKQTNQQQTNKQTNKKKLLPCDHE